MHAEDDGSYVALRVSERSDAAAWWAAVMASEDVPPAIAPLLRGRGRIEVNARDADSVMAWVRSLDGWADANPKPLTVYAAGRVSARWD